MKFNKIAVAVFAIFTLVSCKKNQENNDSISEKPNVLLIVADDLGFSDIGCYGGNISTPVIDGLSKESQLFSNFYVQPTCSPTRSSLLTGCDNHFAGLGIMHEMDYPELHKLNLPEYAGSYEMI